MHVAPITLVVVTKLRETCKWVQYWIQVPFFIFRKYHSFHPCLKTVLCWIYLPHLKDRLLEIWSDIKASVALKSLGTAALRDSTEQAAEEGLACYVHKVSVVTEWTMLKRLFSIMATTRGWFSKIFCTVPQFLATGRLPPAACFSGSSLPSFLLMCQYSCYLT